MSRRRTRVAGLVAALAIAVVVCASKLDRAAQSARRLAEFHEAREQFFRKGARAHDDAARDCVEYGGETMVRMAAEHRQTAAAERLWADHHAALKHKYARAADRPWLPIPPDPPGP